MALTDEEKAFRYAQANHPALWEVRSLQDLKDWFVEHKEDIDQGAARGAGMWPFTFTAGVAASHAWDMMKKASKRL